MNRQGVATAVLVLTAIAVVQWFVREGTELLFAAVDGGLPLLLATLPGGRSESDEKAPLHAVLEEAPETREFWAMLALRYVSEGIVCIDEKGYCSFINPKASELLGWNEQQLAERPLHALLHPPDCDRGVCALIGVQELRKGHSRVNDQFATAAGESMPVDYVIDPIVDGGKYLGAVLVFRDASERLEIERLHAHEEQRLVEYSRQMEEFTYQFAHDIKEPFRSLNYSCDFLREELGDSASSLVSDLIDNISDACQRLNRLIEDSLAYAVARSEELNMRPVPLNGVLDKVHQSLRLLIEEHGAQLHVDKLPAAMADPVQIERVFQNLVQNAVKFHGDQPPTIHVYQHPSDDPEFVVVAVRDNGIGIEREYLDKIFGVFQRLHATEKYSGSGIGLAFVRKSLERQGGSVWVESERGVGSTFYLRMKKSVSTLS